jgi:hypothetical protein
MADDTPTPEPDTRVIADLTVQELKETFYEFLVEAQTPGSLHDRIWATFLAKLETKAVLG